MKITSVFLLSVILLASISEAEVQIPPPTFARNAQISGKLFAVTVIRGCPTEERIDEMIQKGVALGADYTTIPEVAGASFCPATFYGPMWGWHQVWEIPYQSADVQFYGGVIVGLHYRVEK